VPTNYDAFNELPEHMQREALMHVPTHDAGDILDYLPSGKPIYAQAGGAPQDFTDWLPEEFGSSVIQKVTQNSAWEAYGQRVPMTTYLRSTPRDGGASAQAISKGGTYPEDSGANDDVLLTVQKFGDAFRIDEEDIADTLADTLSSKMNAWGTSVAKLYDNSSMAVSAAKSSYTVPDGGHLAFDSVYYQLTQNGTGTDSAYVGGTNINKVLPASASGTLSYFYNLMSKALGQIEQSDFYDEETLICVCHPFFKEALRETVDGQGHPIFQESSSGFPGGGQGGTNYLLFGHPLKLSHGMRLSAGATGAPTGNPLMMFASSKYMLNGIRSGPESVYIDGRNGLAALQDQSILKARMRRAAAPGTVQAFSMVEWQSVHVG
jgi:hypothetical protein